MSAYTFTLMPDHVLAQRFDRHAISHRQDFALFLAELAEFDTRKLWAPAGYHSTADYCERKHMLDHDLACRWIGVARAGHRFPVIFPALADGRLSQTTVMTLKPYLISHRAHQLIAAAMGKSRRDVERMLAAEFPRPDVPTEILSLAPAVVETTQRLAAPSDALSTNLVAPVQVAPSATARPTIPVVPPPARARVAALSPDRNALQVTIDDETVELLQQAKELLSHAMPNAPAGAVLKRALQALVREMQRHRLARVDHPRGIGAESANRHIPAHVKREVSARDGDSCGFRGPDGHRCGSRDQLEWDHTLPVARGGRSTTENVRQLCRAHNQYEAERRFGKGFMQEKRRLRA